MDIDHNNCSGELLNKHLTIPTPKSALTQTLVPQLEVLRLLPSRGVGTTVSEIKSKLDHQGIEVSKRMQERDLHELSRFFGIFLHLYHTL
jgi:hypothetical protein